LEFFLTSAPVELFLMTCVFLAGCLDHSTAIVAAGNDGVIAIIAGIG
jgi:hypothetical protein